MESKDPDGDEEMGIPLAAEESARHSAKRNPEEFFVYETMGTSAKNRLGEHRCAGVRGLRDVLTTPVCSLAQGNGLKVGILLWI